MIGKKIHSTPLDACNQFNREREKHMVNNGLQKLKRVGQNSLDILFKPAETPLAKWIVTVLLVVLFAAGILHWGYFLTWFNNRFNIGDWHRFVEPYIAFLVKSFQARQLPLQGSAPLLVPGQYLEYPTRSFSPQDLLLSFVKPEVYIVINLWIFYTIGFTGLLLISTRYHLSLASFIFLFLLFNFNGHITDHYVVGHTEWTAYFLLPFFVLLVLQMLEGQKTGWGWLFCMALIMLIINLQGGFHFFVWCMAFLFLLALFQPRYWITVVKAIITSALISMIRLLPPAIAYFNGGGIQFIFGFLSISHMIDSFVVLHPPYILDTPNGQIGGWEVDYYLGLIGFLFMIYFGVIRNWVNEKGYRVLYFPMLVMAFFSIGDIYRPIFYSHIPFADSQRAPTRFIIVPIVFLIILASIQFQNWIKDWNNDRWMEKMAVLIGLAFIGYDLFEHSRAWRLSNLTTKVLERYTDIIQVTLVAHPDSRYILAIIIGLALTVLSFIALAVLAYREKRTRLKPLPLQTR
jgi:hypothetical protein